MSLPSDREPLSQAADALPTPRLVEQPGELGRLVMRANREALRGLDADAAWATLEQRQSARWPSWGSRWLLALSGVSAVVLLALFGGLRATESRTVAMVAPSSSASVGEPRSRELQRSAVVEVTRGPRSLVAGRNLLSVGVTVTVSEQARATVSRVGTGTELKLSSGELSLAVEHRSTAEALSVVAAEYRFAVVGTRFTVALEGATPTLEVREGTVAVYRGEAELARVSAGGQWRPANEVVHAAVEAAAPAGIRSPASGNAEVPGNERCAELVRAGEVKQADGCYLRQSEGGGLGAQMALYELARLRANVLGKRQDALAALEDYERRFPQGALAREVALSRLEQLVALGRVQSALELSQQLLQEPTAIGHREELHRLRGDLYRKGGSNCTAAVGEYDAVIAGAGTARADAEFWRAECLLMLGRVSEAQVGYQRYLTGGAVQHRARAEERLQRLQEGQL